MGTTGDSPRVSIGFPVYNGERYVAQALDSLLGQTYRDFELVICDNASTDATESICRAAADRDARVRYHRNAHNLGAAPNFNLAFSLCKSPYFKWAAHDDVYAPTYLAKCVQVLDSDPSAVLCHSQTLVIDEQGQRIASRFAVNGHGANGVVTPGEPGVGKGDSGVVADELYEKPRRLDLDKPHDRFSNVLLATRRCYEVFGLTRREALARTALHESYYGSDKVILSALSLMGRLIEIPEPLFYRRHHGGASGAILSVSQREAWIDASAKKRKGWSFPRVRCLHGYCRSVLGADLGWRERAGCMTAVARYLVRPDRWRAVLREPW